MPVEVTPILNRGRVAEEVIGAPRDDVSPARRDIAPAVGAPVRLLGAVSGNITNEPFAAPPRHALRTTVRQVRHIAHLTLGAPPVLTPHAKPRSPPVIRLPELPCRLPAAVAVLGVPVGPLEVIDRVVAVAGNLAARVRLDHAARAG